MAVCASLTYPLFFLISHLTAKNHVNQFLCDSASFIVQISYKRGLQIKKIHRESVLCPFISRSRFHLLVLAFGAIIHEYFPFYIVLFLYINNSSTDMFSSHVLKSPSLKLFFLNRLILHTIHHY